MIKKILCLLFALSLCAVFPAAAEESSPLPVTAQELSALLQSVRAQVLDTEPLNDPSEVNSRSEDGILLLYETAYLYAEDTRLTAETPVNALVFKQGEGPVLRDTGLDSMLDDVLAAYPLENETLAGTREDAVLYLGDTDGGGHFGASTGYWYGIKQELCLDGMPKLGILTNTVRSNIPEIIKIESQYLTALNGEYESLMESEDDYRGGGDD